MLSALVASSRKSGSKTTLPGSKTALPGKTCEIALTGNKCEAALNDSKSALAGSKSAVISLLSIRDPEKICSLKLLHLFCVSNKNGLHSKQIPVSALDFEVFSGE